MYVHVCLLDISIAPLYGYIHHLDNSIIIIGNIPIIILLFSKGGNFIMVNNVIDINVAFALNERTADV